MTYTTWETKVKSSPHLFLEPVKSFNTLNLVNYRNLTPEDFQNLFDACLKHLKHQIQSIHFGNNLITPGLLMSLKDCPNLQKIKFFQAQVFDELLDPLCSCEQLIHLHIEESSHIRGQLNLDLITKLQTLCFKKCEILDPKAVANIKQINSQLKLNIGQQVKLPSMQTPLPSIRSHLGKFLPQSFFEKK